MGYETSPFGNGGTNVTQDVNNHYGTRDTGKTVGVTNTSGFVQELTLNIDGDMVSAGAYALLAPEIPANAIIEDVYMEVIEAFVLGGTTPVIDVGTEGTEATNGFTITETQAETVGMYDLTSALSGTWAAGLAADTTVGLLLGGATPTVTSAGKAKIVIRYIAV